MIHIIFLWHAITTMFQVSRLRGTMALGLVGTEDIQILYGDDDANHTGFGIAIVSTDPRRLFAGAVPCVGVWRASHRISSRVPCAFDLPRNTLVPSLLFHAPEPTPLNNDPQTRARIGKLSRDQQGAIFAYDLLESASSVTVGMYQPR